MLLEAIFIRFLQVVDSLGMTVNHASSLVFQHASGPVFGLPLTYVTVIVTIDYVFSR